ncbi:MAG: hypothetical protein AB2L24_00485 [Mangrovibacterium sp.]
MECLAYKSEIKNTFSSVRAFSFTEKKSPLLDEKQINKFLDTLSDLKTFIISKTQKIDEINERMEKLTWFNDLDDECLMLINDLISSAKDLHSSLIRQYIKMNFLRKRGIARDEIKNFKNSVDELKESYSDLESVFFFLPKIPDFIETTKELSLI